MSCLVADEQFAKPFHAENLVCVNITPEHLQCVNITQVKLIRSKIKYANKQINQFSILNSPEIHVINCIMHNFQFF